MPRKDQPRQFAVTESLAVHCLRDYGRWSTGRAVCLLGPAWRDHPSRRESARPTVPSSTIGRTFDSLGGRGPEYAFRYFTLRRAACKVTYVAGVAVPLTATKVRSTSDAGLGMPM